MFPPQAVSPRILTFVLPVVNATATFYFGGFNDFDHETDINSKHQILGCELNVATTVATHATNNWNIALIKTDGTPRTIAALTNDSDTAYTWTDSAGATQTTGLGVAFTAGTPRQFIFTTEIPDTILDKDDTLYMTFTKNSSAADIAVGATLKIAYAYGKVR